MAHVQTRETTYDEPMVEQMALEMDSDKAAQEDDEPIGGDNDEVTYTIHALASCSNPQTMKVNGLLKRQQVTVLIDIDSTDNFLNASIAQRFSIPTKDCEPFDVTLDGGTLTCKSKCSNVKLAVQDLELRVDLYLLSLGDYKVVLGIEWLRTLGDVMRNFSKLTMKFTLNGKRVIVRGKRGNTVTTINSHCMEHILTKTCKGYLLQLRSETTTMSKESRSHDHRIPLLPGSAPTYEGSYRYPHFQTTEIERIMQKMRVAGLIRPSINPSSFMVLLVRKKDGSWCLCVDYRALSGITLKNKYPIPVINELLYELGGAHHFSKLDLRSGYHEIRARHVSEAAFSLVPTLRAMLTLREGE
jgi:hypothetical protein